VIVVAGFLPGTGAVPERAEVLVVHGLDDTVVDPFHGELVARRCRRHGCQVTELHHPGGHHWDDEVTRGVLAWLQGG
jgi:predicted esterase